MPITSGPETKKSAALPTIAIVGRPNVGKSSLFNAIVGRRVSIVHEMPGVTRDRVVAPLARGVRRFQLIDTGGLGMLPGESRKVDVWDSRIADQVKVAVEDADVLIFVANVQDGVVNLDEEVARKLRESGKPVLLAANKCDNPALADQAVEFMRLGFAEVYPVSCLHRNGVNALVESAIGLLPETERPREDGGVDGLDSENIARKLNIAVVGRPNVGKSSLVNALLGEERVMVSDVAGTTRDAIDVDFELRFRGAMHPATLVDTAGLRKTAKVDTVVEYFSVMRAKSAIERADLILFVVEASPDGVTAQDRRIAGLIQQSGKGCVLVANKFDVYKETYKVKQMESEVRYSLPGMNYAPLVFVSARDRWNLDGLLDRIAASDADRAVLILPCLRHMGTLEPWMRDRYIAVLLEKLRANRKLHAVYLSPGPAAPGEEDATGGLLDSLRRLAREYDVQLLEPLPASPAPAAGAERTTHTAGELTPLFDVLKRKL